MRVPNTKRTVSFLTIMMVLVSTFLAFNTPLAHAQASSPGKYFDKIVTIVMENEGICDVLYANISYWGGISCGASCPPTPCTYMPYATGLAKKWALSTYYNSTDTPGSSFSLKNYLAMFSGKTWGCTSDDDPNSSSCTTSAWTSTNSNLVDRLPSSVTWKAYMENMTSNCQTTSSSSYALHHDPFVYFNDIVGNSTRCGQVVPAGTNGALDSSLLNDLNSPNAPNLMWLTPNLCDSMHTICTGSNNQTLTGPCPNGTNTTYCCRTNQTYSQCLPVGDSYLKNLVPSILSSYTFTHERAALFITFDEGDNYCPVTNGSQDCLYAVWAGPVTKTSFYSASQYGHYSWLRTIENNWKSSPQCLSNDCNVPDMGEFFIPSFSMSTSPSSVSILCTEFGCSPASTANSNLTVFALNQLSGNVNLAYIAPPNAVSGVYLTGPSSATLPLNGNVTKIVTAHAGGPTSGTFVWTINGSVSNPPFSINTTLTIHYTWCAHCILPGH